MYVFCHQTGCYIIDNGFMSLIKMVFSLSGIPLSLSFIINSIICIKRLKSIIITWLNEVEKMWLF
jgi:hypothetical protein